MPKAKPKKASKEKPLSVLFLLEPWEFSFMVELACGSKVMELIRENRLSEATAELMKLEYMHEVFNTHATLNDNAQPDGPPINLPGVLHKAHCQHLKACCLQAANAATAKAAKKPRRRRK